jgi:hypothetical protein
MHGFIIVGDDDPDGGIRHRSLAICPSPANYRAPSAVGSGRFATRVKEP